MVKSSLTMSKITTTFALSELTHIDQWPHLFSYRLGLPLHAFLVFISLCFGCNCTSTFRDIIYMVNWCRIEIYRSRISIEHAPQPLPSREWFMLHTVWVIRIRWTPFSHTCDLNRCWNNTKTSINLYMPRYFYNQF